MLLSELQTGFVIGLFATVNPCALPLYPGFLAYIAAAGERSTVRGAQWLGLVVLAGVLTTMLAFGALVALLAVSAGSVLRVITPVADVVVIALGVLLLAGRNPFARLPTLGGASFAGGGARQAYVYGVLYGPIALPCAAPLVVALFGLSLSLTDLLSVLGFFLAFGLGFGLPLLGLSLLAYSRQVSLVRFFVRHYALVSRAAGLVLIVVGALDLANNLPFLLLSI